MANMAQETKIDKQIETVRVTFQEIMEIDKKRSLTSDMNARSSSTRGQRRSCGRVRHRDDTNTNDRSSVHSRQFDHDTPTGARRPAPTNTVAKTNTGDNMTSVAPSSTLTSPNQLQTDPPRVDEPAARPSSKAAKRPDQQIYRPKPVLEHLSAKAQSPQEATIRSSKSKSEPRDPAPNQPHSTGQTPSNKIVSAQPGTPSPTKPARFDRVTHPPIDNRPNTVTQPSLASVAASKTESFPGPPYPEHSLHQDLSTLVPGKGRGRRLTYNSKGAPNMPVGSWQPFVGPPKMMDARSPFGSSQATIVTSHTAIVTSHAPVASVKSISPTAASPHGVVIVSQSWTSSNATPEPVTTKTTAEHLPPTTSESVPLTRILDWSVAAASSEEEEDNLTTTKEYQRAAGPDRASPTLSFAGSERRSERRGEDRESGGGPRERPQSSQSQGSGRRRPSRPSSAASRNTPKATVAKKRDKERRSRQSSPKNSANKNDSRDIKSLDPALSISAHIPAPVAPPLQSGRTPARTERNGGASDGKCLDGSERQAGGDSVGSSGRTRQRKSGNANRSGKDDRRKSAGVDNQNPGTVRRGQPVTDRRGSNLDDPRKTSPDRSISNRVLPSVEASSPRSENAVFIPRLQECEPPAPSHLSSPPRTVQHYQTEEKPLCVVPPSMEQPSSGDPANRRYQQYYGGGPHDVSPALRVQQQLWMNSGAVPSGFVDDNAGYVVGYGLDVTPGQFDGGYRNYQPEGLIASGGSRTVPAQDAYAVQSPREMYKMSATEKNIREAMELEVDLTVLLNQQFSFSNQQRLGQCRWKIQLRYENAILSNIEFCAKNNIDQVLWKAAFYQVIENYRSQMVDNPIVRDEVRRALINLIDEGVVFYENLLEKLQDRFEFNLNEIFDATVNRERSLSKSTKLALVSAQKTTICLGDLARYREQACDGAQFGKARSWYLKAQQLLPKNGRPYNQLAILAVYARRKLDAVYYYMRSLAASNPFQTAKEGLISIFDDARRKFELMDKSLQSARQTQLQQQTTQQGWRRAPTASYRQLRGHSRHESRQTADTQMELWYTADGRVVHQGVGAEAYEESDSEDDQCQEFEDDLKQLSAVELSKKFSLSFLHVHGKLFSRIGMDTFGEACIKMLREFRALLRARPTPIDEKRLLQIITINMFAIYNAGMKGADALVAPHCQPVVQSRALEVGVEMFRLLVERAIELLHEEAVFGEELQQLLPSIKVWCDWFMCSTTVWHPLPSITDLGSRSENHDVWSEFCILLNIFSSMDLNSVHIIFDRKEGCEPLVLPEDTTLDGFFPLMNLSQKPYYVMQPLNRDVARNQARVQRIQFCGLYLSGIHPPVIHWNVERKEYVPMVVRRSSASSDDLRPAADPYATDNEQHETSLDDQATPSEEWDDEGWADNTEGLQLRRRKYELEREKASREQQRRQHQAVLQEVAQPQNVRFEVHPYWLVPDTNCFIDHLQHLCTLVASKKYNLVVPLIVINELDGLSRGLRGHAAGRLLDTDTQAHQLRVTDEAKSALAYLDNCFLTRDTHVKAVTARGSLLDTIAYRSEDTYDNTGTNDDIILACCLKLCETGANSSDKQPIRKDKDDMTHVRKNVVLLTDDRNLRVKAHAHEMPVKDIPRFMELMNLSPCS